MQSHNPHLSRITYEHFTTGQLLQALFN